MRFSNLLRRTRREPPPVPDETPSAAVVGDGDHESEVVVAPVGELTVQLPESLFAGPSEAAALVDTLPDDLSSATVTADGRRTPFLGPRYLAVLVEGVCLQRHGYLVVVGLEGQVAERLNRLAFTLGASERVSTVGTVPAGVAFRRRPLAELAAGSTPAGA